MAERLALAPISSARPSFRFLFVVYSVQTFPRSHTHKMQPLIGPRRSKNPSFHPRFWADTANQRIYLASTYQRLLRFKIGEEKMEVKLVSGQFSRIGMIGDGIW